MLIVRLLSAIIRVAVPTSFHVRLDFHGCLFPFLENFRPVAPLIAYYRRTGRSRLDTSLNLQPTRHCLVVLVFHDASLDVGLDLQAMSHCLVMVMRIPLQTSLDTSFDL